MNYLFFSTRLLLLVPAFALIGAANQHREWLGGIVGALIELFFALVMMGRLPPGSQRVVERLEEIVDRKACMAGHDSLSKL